LDVEPILQGQLNLSAWLQDSGTMAGLAGLPARNAVPRGATV
jgi:hypothetical protein